MSTYLIDFENVKSAGLTGIDKIAATDAIHLFWSVRENKISIEMMELIRKSPSEIVMHKASIGERDALDHQLCSFMGYLAGQDADKEFVIISNDKAYDHLIEFWKELRPDIKMVRVPEILKVSGLAKPVVAEVKPESNPEANQRGRKNNRSKNSRNQKFDKRCAEEVKTETAETAKITEAVADEENIVQFDSEMIDSLMEIVGDMTEEKSSFWSNPQPEAVTPVKKPEKTLVVTGFVSSEVRESGYTADGIMPSYIKEESTAAQETELVSEETSNPASEEAVDSAAEVSDIVDVTAEEAVVEEDSAAAEIPVEEEAAAEVSAKEESAAEKAVVEEDGIAAEIPAEEETSENEESTAFETSVKEETVVEDPAIKAEVVAGEASATEEKTTEEVSEENVKEEGEAAPKTEKKKTRSSRSRKPRSQKKEAVTDTAEVAEENQSDAIEKPAKSSRKPKAEKGPVSAEDVIARVAEARNAEWLDELVKLINETANRRDMYNQIVKRLGQEHGKSVYYAVKTLK